MAVETPKEVEESRAARRAQVAANLAKTQELEIGDDVDQWVRKAQLEHLTAAAEK